MTRCKHRTVIRRREINQSINQSNKQRLWRRFHQEHRVSWSLRSFCYSAAVSPPTQGMASMFPYRKSYNASKKIVLGIAAAARPSKYSTIIPLWRSTMRSFRRLGRFCFSAKNPTSSYSHMLLPRRSINPQKNPRPMPMPMPFGEELE